jgi:hypothetical protein
MSSGGSNFYSTGATGDQPTTATINSPIAKGPNAQPGGSYNSQAPAPSGGKGGYNSPMTMQDFAEQQPQVYMPPAQPSFYDQAFTNSYYNPSFSRPRMDYGLGGLGNAYARRSQYSPPSPFNGLRMSPIEAQPPMDEMRMGVMGGGEEYWRRMGGLGGMPKQTVDPYQGSYQISEIPYQGPREMAQATTLGPESLMGGLGGLTSGLGALGGSDANRAAKKGAIASHVIDPEAGRRHAEEIGRQNEIAMQKMMEEIRASQLDKFTYDAIQG